MPNQHTYRPFDEELESVRSRALEMGGLVEEQVVKAVDALVNGKPELAEEVIDRERQINAMELASDEACTQIIARRCPAAGDLRMIMTIIRTIHDLERIGDEAVKIARYARHLQEAHPLMAARYGEIEHMTDLVLRMLRQSLDAFARVDATGAATVARQDIEVDEEFHRLTRHLVTFMMEDARTISASIDLLFVVKAIERIGDHAKNISEYVVFMVKGKDVRHSSIEEIERELL